MRNVGIFSWGRKQSQRCPNKMLRPFAETTLADIILGKLATFGQNAFFAAHEPEFRDKAREHGVPFVQRDYTSATIDEPIRRIQSFLEDISFDHLLMVNGCLPFLQVATIKTFLEDCIAHEKQAAFAVMPKKNHIMTRDRRALNFDAGAKTINTKKVEPLIEFAHALYFFDRNYFLAEGRYWDWATVRLVEAGGKMELLDIDTEEEFDLCQALWRGVHAR